MRIVWEWDQLPPVLTTEDASKILRIHVVNVRILCEQGKLPAAKIGRQWRIDREQLRRYLNGGGA